MRAGVLCRGGGKSMQLIYLAAGNSRRFGGNKLLYELDGMPLYRHLLERLIRVCERHASWEILVVTQYEVIYDAVKGMKASGLPVRPVFSPDSRKGASYSVRAGVEAASGETEGYAFFVGDQPYLTERSAEGFLIEMEGKQAKLGCVRCGEVVGNPAWFAREYREELLALEGDRGGRKLLRKYPERVVYYEIGDAGELEDIDVPMV